MYPKAIKYKGKELMNMFCIKCRKQIGYGVELSHADLLCMDCSMSVWESINT